jgi:archaemetzincin
MAGHAKPVIAVQYFSDFDNELLDIVHAGIDSVFDAYIVFLPVVSLPESAYYTPRKRYRAEKLLDFLVEQCPDDCTKIVGLTAKDISTTKGEYDDWGIFGLGQLGGRACVVSTYRLGRGQVSDKRFHERLVKVINHELGHTFGLLHCSNKGCLMEDAKGMIKTVDQESGKFCLECKKYLAGIIK